MNNESVALKFPTMLRKMWSGGEVQAWLDKLPPLYTAPQMKQLSDEEILEIYHEVYVKHHNDGIDFARAILKKASKK